MSCCFKWLQRKPAKKKNVCIFPLWFYANLTDKINLLIVCVCSMRCVCEMLSKQWKSSSVSQSLGSTAERRAPSPRCLSSCYLLCPSIREPSLFFSHPALPCIQAVSECERMWSSVCVVNTWNHRESNIEWQTMHTYHNTYTYLSSKKHKKGNKLSDIISLSHTQASRGCNKSVASEKTVSHM